MLSRWTRKDAQNGSSSNGSGGDRPDAGSSTGGQLSPTATANGSGSGSYPWPYDKEKHGIDGLTPSERAMLEGLERFYGMENVGPSRSRLHARSRLGWHGFRSSSPHPSHAVRRSYGSGESLQ